MNTENVLLSVSEARKQLGVSSQSVRRFISEGQLIGEKTDTGRWAVEPESVRQLLARRKSPHDAKPHATQQAINIATKAVKEIRYHADHSSKWMVRLGDGTAESHSKIQQSLNDLWQFTDEMFVADESDLAGVASGLLPDFSTIKAQWQTDVSAVLSEAGLTHPEGVQMKLGGRSGNHTPHLAVMLEEMQVLPRLHPDATW